MSPTAISAPSRPPTATGRRARRPAGAPAAAVGARRRRRSQRAPRLPRRTASAAGSTRRSSGTRSRPNSYPGQPVMDYAIIRLGNKQHRVRDGETLVVDRVRFDEGKSFEPDVLLGEGKVTATVVAHERGPKIVIGKYKKRTG